MLVPPPRLPLQLIKWVRSAEQGQLDVLLAMISGVSQREAKMVAAKGWEPAERAVVECHRVVESSHPMRAGTDSYETITFPGANHIKLAFSDETCTKKTSAYVTIYKDASCTAFYGTYGGSGADGDWPGQGGRARLIVPGDTFVLHFHSDSEASEWGYRLEMSAPISPDSAAALAKTQRPGRPDGETWPQRYGLKALAASNNDYEAAAAYLVANEAQLDAEAAEEEEQERREREEAERSGEAKKLNGVFRDPSGVLEVNLQTCEVYVQGRSLMPVPGDVATHDDYSAVFANEHALCNV